jgi:hypothetical protein
MINNNICSITTFSEHKYASLISIKAHNYELIYVQRIVPTLTPRRPKQQADEI